MMPLAPELAPLLRTVAALAGVLLLLLALAWLLRRHGAGGSAAAASGRLAIVASRMVDARIRLVLVRRDAVEHLLAIGPTGVTLVETVPAASSSPAPEEAAA